MPSSLDRWKELNSSQRRAVTAPAGPLLVLAGAGSGKTRAIAYRIAFLIHERGVPPWSILALTFTNKAAGEMRSRVASLLKSLGGEGRASSEVAVYTFHALALRLLRRFGTDIGLPQGFAIYDEEDRRSVLRRVLSDLGLTERDCPVSRLARSLSAWKNAAPSDQGYPSDGAARSRQLVDQIAPRYQSLLHAAGAVDFDDLLLRCTELMEHSSAARSFAERRFQHVHVDEYQDTNRIQYHLLQLLAPHGNLFVVGDEDQAIYGFRGADLRNILDFERDFPSARLIKLEHNYRSTAAILDAASALITCNDERKGKRLIPCLEAGNRPRVYAAGDDREEAGYVARQIEGLRRASPTARVAVLFRTHAQTRVLEEEFIGRSIPYTVVGGLRFYERREIKDALAYLRLLLNPHDDASFQRVVNFPPRGVGRATLALIENAVPERGASLWEATAALIEENVLPSRAKAGLASFRNVLAALTNLAGVLTPSAVVTDMLERTGLARAVEKDRAAEAPTHLENLNQLVTAAAEYQERAEEPTLAAFLDTVTLMTDLDGVGEDVPCLLMTLHSAKGLEFDAVFLTGLEEGLFPHLRSLGSARSLEEERRLCYVGMTRAKSQLTLTYALSRRSALEKEGRIPSRFLQEIPPELLEIDAPAALKTSFPAAGPSARLSRGMLVRHPTFGDGTVVEARGPKVTVVFHRVGRKKLLASFARLEVLTRRTGMG